MTMNLDLALALIDAAKAKAKAIGVPMVIAVVDGGANLIALQRMDQALLVSIDIAVNKAYSAVATKVPTHELAKVAQPGQPLFGIHNTDRGRIVIFGGGFPLSQGNEIIGGIGVSGGSVEEDMLCAEAALKYFKTKPKPAKAGKAKK
jgi:uncharacterized protein GlcG (DUF336 family)